MKQYTPKLQRDTFIEHAEGYSTEYDYNKEHIPVKSFPSREIRFMWFESFGFAYWRDSYAPVWHFVVKKTYNIVFLFVRIQIVFR